MSNTAPSLLLLVPAYNEERRIGPMLAEYAEYLLRYYPGRFQLVVVLNGCTDRTLDVVRAAERRHLCISHLNFPGAIGKGGALIEGLKLAPLADLIGYVDADGASPPSVLCDLAKRCAEEGVDCAIASRWLPDAKVNVAQTRGRRVASRMFHYCVQFLFWMDLADTQCGAKVMRRQAVASVQSQLRLADLAFDVNLLYSLKRNGFYIIEIPTIWTDKSGSKVAFNFKTTLNMLLSLIRLRLLYSPFYRLLKPLRPIEAWIYCRLNAPPPLSSEVASHSEPAELERNQGRKP